MATILSSNIHSFSLSVTEQLVEVPQTSNQLHIYNIFDMVVVVWMSSDEILVRNTLLEDGHPRNNASKTR